MATLTKDGKTWRIRYVDGDGRRHGIRLPGFTKNQAAPVLSRVKELLVAKTANQQMEIHTATWLADVDDSLHQKLVKGGLVGERVPDPEPETEELPIGPTLGEFLDGFIRRGRTVKDGLKASRQTLNKWKGTRDLLTQCFDSGRPLNEFTLEDGRTFRSWMEKRKIAKTGRNTTGSMSENSMRQRMANCKTFFNYAVEEQLIESNPFRRQHSSLVKHDKGKMNIPVEVIAKVIEAAPNVQWRLLIALWRYCGLRKMEPMNLQWSDVLWSEGKLRVVATKTSHHEGKANRYVPIRDVESYLLDAAELRTDDGRIINQYRASMSNLHKPMVNLVEAAGIEVWPNLFKNLRSSCENDWLTAREAPAHVIAGWMGHSVDVQNDHYAMVSEGHFESFNSRPTQSGPFRGPAEPDSGLQAKANGPLGGPKTLGKAFHQQKRWSEVLPQGLEP